MRITADPNNPTDFVYRWGKIKVTLDGKTLDPSEFVYASSSTVIDDVIQDDGEIHYYTKTRVGQILTLKGVPKAESVSGKVVIETFGESGCKPCQRNALKRKQWWKSAHLIK